MRSVLDTNVLVRALMNPQGVWGDVIKRADEYVQVTSPELVLEFLRITDDPRVRRRLWARTREDAHAAGAGPREPR